MKPRKPQQTTKTVIDKLRGRGPETFTGEELRRLQTSFEKITQENLQCRRALYGISEALQRHNLQVTNTTNPDGSMGFNLELVPPDVTKPLTVN